MTLPQFALDYNACKYQELRRFIHDRTGTKAPMAKKAGLIVILQELDSNPRHFRFLDLYPELRNAIYELTLAKNKNKGLKAYPALLRTCKQVYGEGRSILDAGSVAELSMHFKPTDDRAWRIINQPSDGRGLRSLVVANGDVDFSFENPCLGSTRLQEGHIEVQLQVLSRVRTLHLDLTFPRTPIWSVVESWIKYDCITPSDMLRELVAQCKGLRHLKITVHRESDGGQAMQPPPAPQDPDELELTALTPLLKLSEKVTLDVGGLDQPTYEEFWRRAQVADIRAKRAQASCLRRREAKQKRTLKTRKA